MYVADSSYASTTVRFSVLFINNINNANVIVFQRLQLPPVSSNAIASPAPVLGDFRLCLFTLAEPDLFPFPLSCCCCSVRLLRSSASVLESNSLTVSRTRDLRASADIVGLTGPVVGDARTRPVCTC